MGVLHALLQERLSDLLYRGFLSETGWQQLHHYPRYLKSIYFRYERAELNPQAEHERSLTWDKWWDNYQRLAEKNYTEATQAENLRKFRWLLEEFHVSLFAQQLGTKQSVSEKRLNILLEQF